MSRRDEGKGEIVSGFAVRPSDPEPRVPSLIRLSLTAACGGLPREARKRRPRREARSPAAASTGSELDGNTGIREARIIHDGRMI